MKTYDLFSVQVHDIQHNLTHGLHVNAMEECKQLKETVPGHVYSNQGGYQSVYSVYEDQKTAVGEICESLRVLAEEALGCPLNTSSAWVNINEQNNWNLPHAHQPRAFVGVYYLDIEDEPVAINGNKDGHLIVFDPSPMIAPGRMDSICTFAPHKGRFLVFPGYLWHMVAPHFSEHPRVSIAVNFDYPETI